MLFIFYFIQTHEGANAKFSTNWDGTDYNASILRLSTVFTILNTTYRSLRVYVAWINCNHIWFRHWFRIISVGLVQDYLWLNWWTMTIIPLVEFTFLPPSSDNHSHFSIFAIVLTLVLQWLTQQPAKTITNSESKNLIRHKYDSVPLRTLQKASQSVLFTKLLWLPPHPP